MHSGIQPRLSEWLQSPCRAYTVHNPLSTLSFAARHHPSTVHVALCRAFSGYTPATLSQIPITMHSHHACEAVIRKSIDGYQRIHWLFSLLLPMPSFAAGLEFLCQFASPTSSVTFKPQLEIPDGTPHPNHVLFTISPFLPIHSESLS